MEGLNLLAPSIDRHELVLPHFQLYAVQRWILDRAVVFTLAVYTADPDHSIAVSILTPDQWQTRSSLLAEHGASPRQTPHGLIMATDLANFPSDLAIVLIPNGHFPSLRPRLYANINLLRMGCSGRSALSLDDPSESTKDRFFAMYHIQPIPHVLELVTLVQIALSIFAIDVHPDGLLCDRTVDGLKRWLTDVGDPCFGIESIERPADPVVLSALLSLVLATRNKLAAVSSHHLPKDPFLHPNAFCAALAVYAQSNVAFLTRPLIHAISTAYEKARHTDSRRVRRALLHNLRVGTGSEGEMAIDATAAGPGYVLHVILDMGTFARAVTGKGDHDRVGASLRALWSGDVASLAKIREREREKYSDGDEDREKTTEDERPWSGRVQRRIEWWASLSRKKQSVDLSTSKLSLTRDEEEDILSSGQVSPVSLPFTPSLAEQRVHPFRMPPNVPSDYERRLTAFNQSRPNKSLQNRVSSWADPISALEIEVVPDNELGRSKRSILGHGPKRRRSFHDISSWRQLPVTSVERMRIDVELCGQVWVVSRRNRYLDSMLACLQVLTSSLSDTNASLREDYQSHQQFFLDIDNHTKVLALMDSQRLQVEKISQETNTLLYESQQFHMPDLWHMASAPRHQVLALRDRVLGTGGRRLPNGVHGAHGKFNRLQWTLDGKERLVDWLGRSEEEAEEEDGVIEDAIPPGEEEDEDAVEHPGIKPMWLLRMFNTFGGRWGWRRGEDTSQ